MLSFAGADLTLLLEDVRTCLFPGLPGLPKWQFVQATSLACIHHGPSVGMSIYLNVILNHSETPELVYRHIFIHELIHVMVPSRVIDGKTKDHPPEFWEAESRLSPDRDLAWDWLWHNLGCCLVHHKKSESVRVKRGWAQILRDRNAYYLCSHSQMLHLLN